MIVLVTVSIVPSMFAQVPDMYPYRADRWTPWSGMIAARYACDNGKLEKLVICPSPIACQVQESARKPCLNLSHTGKHPNLILIVCCAETRILHDVNGNEKPLSAFPSDIRVLTCFHRKSCMSKGPSPSDGDRAQVWS
jgi:hypothetical protein